MREGLAPTGIDGQKVPIHHIDQTDAGLLTEILKSIHQKNYGILHKNTGQFKSEIKRPAFDSWRGRYWKWRANRL